MSVEFKCDDGSLPYDHPLRRWSRLMLQAGEISGKTFRVVNQARNYLLGAGFVDINEKRHKVPVGTWPAESKMKALGSLNLEQIKAGIDGWTIMPFMRDLRVSRIHWISFQSGINHADAPAYFSGHMSTCEIFSAMSSKLLKTRMCMHILKCKFFLLPLSRKSSDNTSRVSFCARKPDKGETSGSGLA